jgi:alanine-glyoxylate transaminase/serine-glyoxylate transaminase/serine-pyruvate transaminase
MIKEEGLENVWHRHATLARAVWAAIEVWGQAGPVRPNIAAEHKRSHAVTTVNFGPGNGQRLRDWMTTNAGVTLGIPLGGVEGADAQKEDFLRIGHMGHVNAHMVLGLLANLQAGMAAMQIPHGPTGLEAAINVVAQG